MLTICALPLVPLGCLPLHRQNPYRFSSFCAHVYPASHLQLPDSPVLPLEMICTKDFVHDKTTYHNTQKDKNEALEYTRYVILPATGGLGTNGATELALKEGIPRRMPTTGPAPRQLSVWAHDTTGANFNAWANFHTGALHTGALL